MFVGMKFSNQGLELLDQRKLPHNEVWHLLEDLESVAHAIEQMMVRGAPAIAAAALFGLVLDVRNFCNSHENATWSQFKERCFWAIERLCKTRPTAVNLFHVMEDIKGILLHQGNSVSIFTVKQLITQRANDYFKSDLTRNQKIGQLGAQCLLEFVQKRQTSTVEGIGILTHCNTGSLATGGYGTALGAVRSLHSQNQLKMLYVNETRPWLQGSRLTAFEMEKEKIPFKLLADSAAAFAMRKGFIDAVIVGADRIAANGDTANKIGTYQLALAAAHHSIGFFIAASFDTIDFSLSSGDGVTVEERQADELRCIGELEISPRGVPVWNPSFDVTPHELITGIITEKGVATAPFIHTLSKMR